MHSILARFADCAFWMARYMERAENLARILDVNETFAQDRLRTEDWLPVVEINSDTSRLYAKYPTPTVADILAFYMVDNENPTSIISAVRMARENARMLRHLISTEMWTHLNIFYNELRDLSPADVRLSRLAAFCGTVKENSQTHVGIADGTTYRDEVWFFMQLGRFVERADQTTRLLDIKYSHLAPHTAEAGTPTDASQWNAVLRSAAGYHAFRRMHARGMRPDDVAGFLLFDDHFPRSVRHCVDRISELLAGLAVLHRRPRDERNAALVTLREAFGDGDIERVLNSGLHEFLDWAQLELNRLTGELGHSFFGAEDSTQQGQVS